MPSPKPFRSVGRYDLLEVIGRGGAAVVYLAQQRDLRRLVALKELAPVHPGDASFAARFVDESRLAGSLNHPNVVTVHEFFEAEGVPLIAMEYLPEGSLRSYVGALTTAQFAGVLEGVLAGLAHGQSAGVVHRDLKPENLLVTADGRVKIADFGVARAYNQAITREVVTVAGTTIGTPAYMAPEQALGQQLTPATDLYSLGVVAWELLSGHVPFTDNDTPVAVLYRHVHEPVAPISTVVPGVDPRMARWLERMLAKRPEDRFAGADAAWEQLEDVVLDLLGPRWRRESRLVVAEPAEPAPVPASAKRSRVRRRATPPPPVTEVAPAPEPEPVVAQAPEPEPIVVPEPEPDHEVLEPIAEPEPEHAPALTVAPQRPLAVRNPTIVRRARRHRDAPAPDAAAASRWRRLGLAGLLALVAAAAVVAVVLSSSGGAKHPGTTRASTTPQVAGTQTVDRDLLGLLSPLASARSRGLAQLSGAHTPPTQAAAASAIAAAYRTATLHYGQLPAAVRASPQAASVSVDLTQAEQAWTALAAAAKKSDRSGYQRASAQIDAAEGRLRTVSQRL